MFEDKHEKLQATRPLCQQTNQSLGCFWCRTFFGSDFIQFHYSQHPPGTTASMCWYGTLFFIAWRPGSITCKKKQKKKHCHHHAKDLYCIKVRIVRMYIGCILDWCIPSSWWTQYLQGAARTCGSTSPKRHPSTTVLHT